MPQPSDNTPTSPLAWRLGRSIGAVFVPVVLIAACGSGDGSGTVCSTLPSDVSIGGPVPPETIDAVEPPAELPVAETRPPETPAETIAQLHGAVDAIAMSPGSSAQETETLVTQLATQLHTATASARVNLNPS